MNKLLMIVPIVFLAACGQVAIGSVPSQVGSAVLAADDVSPEDVQQGVAWAKTRTTEVERQRASTLQPQLLADPELLGKMRNIETCNRVANNLNGGIGNAYYCVGSNLYFNFHFLFVP